MELPNAERAEVDIQKLSEYCLSPVHPVGKHKAGVFRSALGLTAADAEFLRSELIRAAGTVEAVADRSDQFGDRYFVDFELSTDIGTATVRSAWIVRAGEDFPRLTTCYVITR